MTDPRAEQLVLHREFADPVHGSRQFCVLAVGLTLLQRRVDRRLGPLAPAFQPIQRHAELAGSNSAGSPRINLNTTSRLRATLQR